MRKITFEEFERRAKERHKSKYKYLKETYKNTSSKVGIICPIHGSFSQNVNSHLRGCECPSCYNDRRSITQQFNKADVIKKFEEIHGNLYSYESFEYNGMNKKSKVICPIHGEFLITPNHHLYRKQGCPKCARNKQLSTEEFIDKARNVHGDRYDYSNTKYINAFTKVEITCPIHGSFFQTPHNHIQGRQGCPSCNDSSLEENVKKLLDDNGIEYERQKSFPWLKYRQPMRLDFYLPRHNKAVECQGEQHFTKYRFEKDDEKLKLRQLRDKIKKELCEDNGIELIYFSNRKYGDDILISLNEVLNRIRK